MHVHGRDFFNLVLFLLVGLADLSYAEKLPFSIDFDVEGVRYNSTIPKPEEVIGHRIGTKHTSPDKIVGFFEQVASMSDRVVLRRHGSTYEGRPQIHAIVTAVENHSKLEQLRENNLLLSESPGEVTSDIIAGMPAVVIMGYGVHGNEASGPEAALLLLYHLAAGEGNSVDSILRSVIVIIDPMLNPDGRHRFVSWVNGNRGRVATTDPHDREHREQWPGGRGNHYWFDLNRDWLPVQLKETKGRLQLFHHWRPQVMTDFHEMGSDSTYFFQPGIASRTHPLTPPATSALTAQIANYHARALDNLGSLYYSGETFDDYYFGKGSTYPDINGGVGILFEQAHSRSLRRETQAGILHFDFTIRNQVATSFSTLQAAVELREKLLSNQRNFYLEAKKLADENPVKAYLFNKNKDGGRGLTLIEVLWRHRIKMYNLKRNLKTADNLFQVGEAVIVPASQPQIRLLQTIMDDVKEFQDTTFYDVSAWTIPRALGVAVEQIQEDPSQFLGEELEGPVTATGELVGGQADYAYVMQWGDFQAPKALYRFQAAGLMTRFLVEPAEMISNGQSRTFGSGSIIIPVSQAGATPERVHEIVDQVLKEEECRVYSVATGHTGKGPDLGSPSSRLMEIPRVLLISGAGTNSLQVGETWFLLNERMGIPVSLIDVDWIDEIEFSRYNTLILCGGSYLRFTEKTVTRIQEWIRGGGLLIALDGAVHWAISQKVIEETLKEPQQEYPVVPYSEVRRSSSAQKISGAIFEVALDVTHPIAFGHSDRGTVFRSHTVFVEPSKSAGANVALYTDEPLVSGYASADNLDYLKGSSAVIARKLGSGAVILFVDNPNFRAFCHGTSSLFLNSLFFGRSL